MSSEERIVIISRVRKLLALTASDNANEAALARERADRLIAENQISRSEIDSEGPTDVGSFEAPGIFDESWRTALATVIAKTYHGRLVRIETVAKDSNDLVTHTWKASFICMNQDIDAILYLLAYYETAVEEFVKRERFDIASKESEIAFRRGVVFAFQQRMFEEMKSRTRAPTPETRAIVPQQKIERETENFFQKKYITTEKATYEPVLDRESYYKGIRCGQFIPLIGKSAEELKIKIESSSKNPTNQGASDEPKAESVASG
jgi:hypothetical protein